QEGDCDDGAEARPYASIIRGAERPRLAISLVDAQDPRPSNEEAHGSDCGKEDAGWDTEYGGREHGATVLLRFKDLEGSPRRPPSSSRDLIARRSGAVRAPLRAKKWSGRRDSNPRPSP